MSHNYRKVVNRGDTVTEIPLDWLLRWDAATSDGISYLTDAATNDVDEWISQQGPEALGTLTLLDIGVATNYPEYIRDTDGLPCVHCQDDGALWVSNILASNAALHARIDDASDVTVFVVSKFLDPANETSGNAYCFRGINNFAVGTTGLDDSLDLYTNAAFTAATNGFDNRRFIASMRNVHNGVDDNDTDSWVGKTTIVANTTQTDASVAGPNTITVGSWGASSSTWDSDCNIYEVLIYGRSLSDAEHATVVDYLSYKWQTTNADNSNDIISGPFPNDYAARWDSTTSAGMTFNTDEPTGDIASWVDETGNYTLDQTLTNYPIWTPGAVTFGDDMGLQEITTDFDAANMTLLFAASFDGTAGGGTYDYMVVAPNETSIGNNGGVDEKYAFVMDEGGATIYKSTNDLTDTAMVLGIVNDHIGTNDNDKTPYVGNTALTTESTVSDANSSRGYINLGWYIDDIRSVVGEFYEMLIWSRVLTTDEIADVVGYLSKKWQAGNEDAASPGITSITGRTWVSDYVDPQGEALANYTPINHRIESFPNDPSDPLRGSNKREPYSRFPSSLPNLQTWYRSDYTAGMTFDTGDALAGGTISAFTDLTGTRTLDTATSGVNAPIFHPGGQVRGGFPSIEGGNDTTAAGIEKSAPSANLATGQQRLYWSVGTFGDATKTSSWGGPMSNILMGATYSAMSSDMVAKPAISYAGTLTTGISYSIANAGPPADNGDIHIFVWRMVDTGTDATVESWYAGLKVPDRVSTSVDTSSIGQAIGILSTGNFDANGAQFLEMGTAYSTTATIQEYTDAHVEQLIRYLCDRYNVDYMPATTPITIGCWSRQTVSNALTDCCLWHDPSTIGAGRWPLHPDVAQYHTTPANFDMETGADATSVAMTLSSGELGFQTVSADENVIAHQHMEAANAYDSTETTDFPADTLGMSHFLVMYSDSAGAGSARCGSVVTQVRTSASALLVYGGSTPKTWTAATDKWVLIGNSYAYDDDGTGAEGYPGSTDADPSCYFYLNDETMVNVDTSSSTNFNVECWVNWDISDGVVKCSEQVVFKHPMTIEEIDELRKYFIYKYRRNFDFVNIQPHNVDEDTTAHWSFAGNSLDDLGNKAAFDTGSYSAATTPRPYNYACHSHHAGGGFSYSAQDTDLDTLGPFTFGAAIYLDSLPTGGNWRPVVRSSPPSGGTGLSNNHRYTFRIMDDGTLQYQHQYGNKLNVSVVTTMTVPVGEWFYLGMSRAEDGLSVNIIMNDTIETLSGFANAPENGANARFELFESWDGDDFRGDAFSAIFKNVYTTTGGLHAMKQQVFKEGG